MIDVHVEDDAIVATLRIGAPVEAVFSSLTDPHELTQWWGADGMYRTSDWIMEPQTGGLWSCQAQNAAGQGMQVGGEVLTFDPPSALSYTWNPSWENIPVTVISYRLERDGDATVLHFRHSGFADHQRALKDHVRGWTAVLGWLQEHTQKGVPS